MYKFISRFAILCVCVFAMSLLANAQTPDASSADGRSGVLSKEDLPAGIKETLAKKRIQIEEKEFQDLVANVEEAAGLSDEISLSLEKVGKLSGEDMKKLDRLEKLVKKIRTNLGAKSDEAEDRAPDLTNPEDGKNLQQISNDLLAEIKKIGRYTISVVAIESSNSLLKIIRLLKFNKN